MTFWTFIRIALDFEINTYNACMVFVCHWREALTCIVLIFRWTSYILSLNQSC